MHCRYESEPRDLAQLCRTLEALSEGFAQACQVEIDAAPDDFPCCVKCGEFSLRPVPHLPGGVTRNAFYPGSEIAQTIRTAMEGDGSPEHGSMPGRKSPRIGLRVQCASALARSKEGTSFDLAVFQCAQERRRGRDCQVGISYDSEDNLHAFVVYPDGTTQDPTADTIARNPGCACGEDNDG